MSSNTVTPLSLLVRNHVVLGLRRLKGIREQSRLLSSVIFVFVAGYSILAFWLFRFGLKFMSRFPGLGVLLIERLLFLLFAFLFVLLLLSNLVISYTNFFRNRETNFLCSLPLPTITVYRWKFLESVILASWAFLFLIAPLLAAYGLTRGAPWHFYIVTVVLILMFIVLPAVVAAWAAVNIARYLDRRTFQVITLVVSAVLLIAAVTWLRAEPITDDIMETRVLAVLDRLLVKTRFAQFQYLPSYWISQSVLQYSEGALAASGFFILVLSSYVLFFGYLSFTQMGDRFYEALSMVHSRGSVLEKWNWFRNWQARAKFFSFPQTLLDRLFSRAQMLPTDVRALIIKDGRVFWRDTTQWGQTLVLFGLLGVYIINLRHFSQQLTNPFWVNLVSFLNLGACSLNLATLTTRFVYPQFSLEGKRLWIVGMAPLGLINIVKVKFWMASITSLVVTLSLIWLSCHMLNMTIDRTLFFTATIGVMTFTLNGLAIGLGALYPNFKEENPSKIVSGFGGTFCLVVSFLYILISVALLAVGSPWGFKGAQSFSWVAISITGFAFLSLLVGQLPLHLGLRRVSRFEF